MPQLDTVKNPTQSVQPRGATDSQPARTKPFLLAHSKGERAFYFIILFSFSMHSGHTYLPPKETMCLTLPQNTQAS